MHPQQILKIDAVYILSLDSRKEHWTTLRKDLISRGWTNIRNFVVGSGKNKDLEYDYIDFPAEYDHFKTGAFDAEGFHYGHNLKSKTAHKNALYSHKFMVEEADYQKYKKILMLEDDCVILDRFSDILERVKDKIRDLGEYNLLYLNYFRGNYDNDMMIGDNLQIENNWREHKACGVEKVENAIGGFNGVIINKNFYGHLLNMPNNAPLDMSLNRYHRTIQSYLIYPHMMYVKNNVYSNCEQRIVCRDQL